MSSTLLDLVSPDTRLKRVASTGGGEWAGACPFCGGRDRFRVWPYADRAHYWCRSCQRTGDSIQYIRDKRGLSYQQALQELGLDTSSTYSSTSPYMTLQEPPNKKWMDRGEIFSLRAGQCLWSSRGTPAREYLHRRGFTDETIKAARLGYCPQDFSDDASLWGINSKSVFLPTGIVIPFWANGNLWKITIRKKLPGHAEGRYHDVLGGRDCLFNADKIAAKRHVLLYEGAFNALAGEQEAGDLAVHVATGGTDKCRVARWIARLAEAQSLLIATDNDENKAGDKAAEFWLRAFPSAIRWSPWAKDANDMLISGLGLRKWTELGVSTNTTFSPAQAEILPVHVDCEASTMETPEQENIPTTLTSCRWHSHKQGIYADESGCYCTLCFESRVFHIDAVTDLLESLGWPSMPPLLASDRATYLEQITTLGDVGLGILENALKVRMMGLEGHLLEEDRRTDY